MHAEACLDDQSDRSPPGWHHSDRGFNLS